MSKNMHRTKYMLGIHLKYIIEEDRT